ncbi:MAG: hypothetical protein HeimC2_04490 [Candidatus Heimdallarchaeota archaeon LC_2]|nr:MAG: hypothetical protein HeimC2_04490 [Candidatus Heimdallarchaeota archaeon LC_2]
MLREFKINNSMNLVRIQYIILKVGNEFINIE